MNFATLEELEAYAEARPDEFMVTSGSDGFRLVRRRNLEVVFFLPDDRAAGTAWALLSAQAGLTPTPSAL